MHRWTIIFIIIRPQKESWTGCLAFKRVRVIDGLEILFIVLYRRNMIAT
jgi:hypothetical protein